LTADPCDARGQKLPEFAAPTPQLPKTGLWEPFNDRVAFDFANYHFFKPSSAAQTNEALDFWAAVVTQNEGKVLPQWTTAKELYATIDKIQNGTTPWKTYKIRYQGPTPTENPPKWMTDTYHLCTRDSRHLLHQQLLNSDFKDKIHYTPYMQFNADGNRVYSNLMSGDWAWDQAV
jgi:hypothetical protein